MGREQSRAPRNEASWTKRPRQPNDHRTIVRRAQTTMGATLCTFHASQDGARQLQRRAHAAQLAPHPCTSSSESDVRRLPSPVASPLPSASPPGHPTSCPSPHPCHTPHPCQRTRQHPCTPHCLPCPSLRSPLLRQPLPHTTPPNHHDRTPCGHARQGRRQHVPSGRH